MGFGRCTGPWPLHGSFVVFANNNIICSQNSNLLQNLVKSRELEVREAPRIVFPFTRCHRKVTSYGNLFTQAVSWGEAKQELDLCTTHALTIVHHPWADTTAQMHLDTCTCVAGWILFRLRLHHAFNIWTGARYVCAHIKLIIWYHVHLWMLHWFWIEF